MGTVDQRDQYVTNQTNIIHEHQPSSEPMYVPAQISDPVQDFIGRKDKIDELMVAGLFYR